MLYSHDDRSLRFRTGGNVTRATISPAGLVGIGIQQPDTQLHLQSSADVTADGGGIRAGTVNLTNSTISTNTAHRNGGGVQVTAGGGLLLNATIAFNHADVFGGGVQNLGGAVRAQNTILALGRDFDGLIDAIDDARQHVDGWRNGIEVARAMVRHDDSFHTALHRQPGVFGREDTFEQERDFGDGVIATEEFYAVGVAPAGFAAAQRVFRAALKRCGLTEVNVDALFR